LAVPGAVDLATIDASALYVVQSAHTNHSEFTGDVTAIDRLGHITSVAHYQTNFQNRRITMRPVVASAATMYVVTADGVLHAVGR